MAEAIDPTDTNDLAEVHERPAWAPLTLIAFVSLVICGYIATAVAPNWALNHPEALLALHSRVRHLLLALDNGIAWWSYAVIAALRLSLAFVVCHLIGRAYRNDVLTWFGRYLGSTRESIDQMLGLFDRADWLIVPFFAGSNIVAAITGIRQMSPQRLATLLAIGLAARLAFWYWMAQVFSGQLGAISDFLGRYQTPAIIASVALVVVGVAVNLRRGRGFRYD